MTASPAQEAAHRTVIRRCVDRSLSRILRLPPPTNRYRVTRGVRVPMRDGVELVADVFAPDKSTRSDTVLIRAPYGRGYPLPQFFGQPFAARGFHVVIQSVRGTYGSTGEFVPAVHEADDGLDTVAWLRQQSWFTGRFATIGASYLGLTQWALLQNPPSELKASIILTGPHDYSAAWATGSFTLDDCLGWCNAIANQNEMGPLERRFRSLFTRSRGDENDVPNMPVGAAGRAVLGTGAAWYESWLEHPDRSDTYWEPMRFTDALDRSQVPVFLVNGWQDLNLEQTFEQYHRLHERDVEVALTVGPWTHARMLRQGASTFIPEALEWLTIHLADSGGTRRGRPVRIFVNGDGWLELPQWPPLMPERVAYLLPDGKLDDVPPPADGSPSTFVYDPSDPTPSLGGRLLAPTGGYCDDTALAQRPDVLSFTGNALTEDLYLVGSPVFDLAHSADNPCVDVFVRISQVDAEGRSTNVTDGFRRLPQRTSSRVEQVAVELDAVAHRFPAGSRIRVLVAGGCYPRFVPNHGTGEPIATAERMVPATHHVHHGALGTSRLLLPASDRLPE
ncbi:MAG: uncharacterized protein QOF31_1508 [Mycobacterium sp.]|nr:uncharacterized protein [Mycobacterium sp.]